MAYRGLGAREVVRVLLPAVFLGVLDGHPPRETGTSAQVIYLGLLQFAVGYPRFGDRDVRAGWLLHAVARLYLREVGLDRVAEFLTATTTSALRRVFGFATSGACGIERVSGRALSMFWDSGRALARPVGWAEGLPCLISTQGSRFEADFALSRDEAFSSLLRRWFLAAQARRVALGKR